MSQAVPIEAVPCGLASALRSRGFTELTAIQEAVLSPDAAGRDLRLSSKTGSGKTVAIGLVVAAELGKADAPQRQRRPVARPRVLLIAPTRELAAQIGRELEWLYQPLQARLAVVTGGTNMGGDFRTLAAGPNVVVGTPGRLVDHVQRQSIDLSAVRAVVLDEADEMLDMGFREDLELLLSGTPEDRYTHLVSATFPRDVLGLANRYQRDAIMVAGSPIGAPNQDIAHVGVTVHERDKVSALVNVLLVSGRQRTLVFARTRAGTTHLAAELCARGFGAAALNGEMSQRERTATLESFRAGVIDILVATDVAARGLDIDDIAQVVHFDLPENDEILTHRSGRTGRAGNKGTSVVMTSPRGQHRAQGMFRRLGVSVEWRPVPSPQEVRRSADERLRAEIAAAVPAADSQRALAQELLDGHDPVELVAALLDRSDHRGPCAPYDVRETRPLAHDARRDRKGGRAPTHEGHSPHPRGDFQRFHVTWGANHGANPSRLLAMVCRRGNIHGAHIGAIKVADFSSVVEVSRDIADDFSKAVQSPDPRNPKVRIRPWQQRAQVR